MANRTLSAARALTIVLAVILLVGCASGPEVDNPNAGRYSIQQDRAPSRPFDLASVPPVVPEPLQRTGAGNRSPYSILGRTYRVLATEEGYREQGLASWYGEKFHGHKTSNGEIFDMYRFSAAHKTLPIPSFVKVTNLENNRSLIVRVNDRGPFHGDRLIDLSYAAAVKLGYADRGTARVLLEAVVVPDAYENRTLSADAATSDYMPTDSVSLALNDAPEALNQRFLQVGAFSSLSSARDLSGQLQKLTRLPVVISSVELPEQGVLHRVRIGPVQGDEEIRSLTRRVVAANLGRPYTVTE